MMSALPSVRDADNAFRALLGIVVRATGPGTATVTIDPVGPDLLQGRGIVHGGVYAALVDCAAGEALRSVMAREDDGFTVDLNVTYLRPVSGSRLEALGRAVKCGRSLGVAVADIHDGDGALVATGRATFAVRPRAPRRPDSPTADTEPGQSPIPTDGAGA